MTRQACNWASCSHVPTRISLWQPTNKVGDFFRRRESEDTLAALLFLGRGPFRAGYYSDWDSRETRVLTSEFPCSPTHGDQKEAKKTSILYLMSIVRFRVSF